MKAYITHTTQNYEEVVMNLAKSIMKYSVRPLIVYTIDYDGSEELQKIAICKRLDLDLPKPGDDDFVKDKGIQYVNRGTYRTYMTLAAKIDAMIDAIDTGVTEWVYLDADCVVNVNIDDMFDFVKEVGEYPLATLGPQQFVLLIENGELIGNPFWKEDGSTDITNCLEWPLMNFFGMKEEQRSFSYRTTNILVGNDKVKPFLEIWKNAKDTFPKLFDTYKLLPFHEETLYNVLVWQRDDKGLPMVYINITGADTVEHFLTNESQGGESEFITDFYKLPADKQMIKVFHGEKRSEEVEKIFKLLKRSETDPLKILFLAPHLSTGGMPAFLLRRIQMLQKWTNHEIFVAEWTLYSGVYTVQRDQILKLIPEDHFISLGHLGEDEKTHFDNRVRIVEMCYNWDIDLIHIDEIPEGFDGFSKFPLELQEHLYHEDHPWRIVETCHNIWFDPNKAKKIDPDGYACVVAEHVNNTFKNRGVPAPLLNFPIDSPYNTDKLPTRDEILTELGYRLNGEYHIVNIGLWTGGKNQGYALQIARELYNKYGQTYQFHFIGNQAANFKQYWEPLMQDVPPNCHMHGERGDAYKWLIMADVMLFTSTWECNPIVLAEATSYNTKIMAFDLPQYGGQWTNKITPLINNVGVDASNLVKICSQPRKQIELQGIDGHRFAMAHHKLYTQLVNSESRRHKSGPVQPEHRYRVEVFDGIKFYNLYEKPCDVSFYDNKTGELICRNVALPYDHWFKPKIEYFVEWKIVATWEDSEIEWILNLENKTVNVELLSSSLGDTLAFVEVVRAWVKQNNIFRCNLMTYKNGLFDWNDYQKDGVFPMYPGSAYPPADYTFRVGVHMGEVSKGEPAWYTHRNKLDWRKIYLGDIIGGDLGYEGPTEIRPTLIFKKKERPVKDKYIVIATQSTAQAKYWNNPSGWQELVDWHIANGYKVYLASKENDGYMGNFYPKGVIRLPEPFEDVVNYMQHAEYFIGISSGLSWLAWAVACPVVLISGFTPVECEFTQDTLRIINKDVCNSCWAWSHFDKGDWYWCPAHKGTKHVYECSKTITATDVIKQIQTWKYNNFK